MNSNPRAHVLVGSPPAASMAARAAAQSARPTAAPRPRALLGTPRAEPDPAAAIREVKTAFEQFKATNDENLAKRDVVLDEKIAKIDAAIVAAQATLDDLAAKAAAALLNGTGRDALANSPERAAYAQAYDTWFRNGGGQDQLKALAIKAQLTRQSDPDGGYVVTPEIEKEIDRVLGTVSTMRMLATVRPTGAANYKKRVGLGGAGSGWVGENETRAETATPRIVELEYPAMTLYAEPEATEEMLEDGDFDIEAWLADEVNIAFEEQEGVAHISGNGNKKPRGILSYTNVADANWEWGKLGYIASGEAAAFTDPDKLIDLTTAVKQGFRNNASWLSNRKTMSSIRKMKQNGEYIWQPGLQAGQPSTLLGYPVYDDDNMPDVAAGTYPLAFGDFKRGYLILDRRGVKVLRNPFKTSGFVTFYTTKRTGGGIQHFEAIKLLKVASA